MDTKECQTMKNILFPIILAATLTACTSEAPAPTAEQPAPEAKPKNLQAIDSDEALVTTALLAAPFSAACYHKSLEPFMARGRELKAEGKSFKEIFDIREEEAKAGTLSMGEPGAALHIYYGPSTMYDPAAGVVDSAKYRYVVYMPFATAESTGLPESPIAPNHPWIMNPGTHRAHIMITSINEPAE